MPEPRRLVEVLSELHARRGYARVQSSATLAEAWRAAAGDAIARRSRVGRVRRGVLEVVVADPLAAQELQFQKVSITARLAELLPEEGIRDLRSKVGPIR